MKRYIRLAATYVLIVAAIVLLYAPWGLALRPWDYNILRAGFSIICGIALAGVFGTSTYLALKDPDIKLLAPAQVVSENEIVPVLEEYGDESVVGGIASDALEQVKSSNRKRHRLRKTIEAQFSEGSLSYDRFVSLVEQAYHTVLRNAVVVANNVQSFDRDAYIRAKKHGTGELAVYNEALAFMREVLEANDRVLLEMGKLELELSRLEANDTLDENNQTVEELSALVEQTKYYK